MTALPGIDLFNTGQNLKANPSRVPFLRSIHEYMSRVLENKALCVCEADYDCTSQYGEGGPLRSPEPRAMWRLAAVVAASIKRSPCVR